MELINPYKVPTSEIESRRLKTQQELRLNDIDGLFIVQRVDLFYFSGTAQNGYMYIPAQGQPILFIKQYPQRQKRRHGGIAEFAGQRTRYVGGISGWCRTQKTVRRRADHGGFSIRIERISPG
jgi:Xaa-Pro aminopeptidase